MADELDNTYAIDITPEIAARGAPGAYGQVDKHYSPFGSYLAAKAIYEWLHGRWPRGPRTSREAPPFEDDRWGLERPDCALVDNYRERLLNPVAGT